MEKSNHSSEPDFKFSVSDRLKQAEDKLGKTIPPENNIGSTEEKPTAETQNNTIKSLTPGESESIANKTAIPDINILNTLSGTPKPTEDEKTEVNDEAAISAKETQEQISNSTIFAEKSATNTDANKKLDPVPQKPEQVEPLQTFNTVIGKRGDFDSAELLENPSDILGEAPQNSEQKNKKKSSGSFSHDLGDRYELNGTVGQGGMGIIRSVEDKNLNRTLAMKILSPKYVQDTGIVEAFLEEASLTAQLQHPNIIPVHDIGILPETDNHFYTMKLVDGGSLQDVIDEIKSGNEDYIRKYNFHSMLTIFKKVCDAVAYAHSKGIIHRDIKPGNIMVGPFGEVLLLDWGLAKYSDSNQEVDIKKKLEETNHDCPLMTMDGIIKGSLAYLSPEQANGDIKEIDHQTDIFLLGGTLYHMLTLEPPYTSKNMVEIIRKAETANFIHPNDTEFGKKIPEALVNMITKALACSKTDRFQTVTELSKKVDDYIEGRNVSQLKTYPKGTMLIEDKELEDDTFVIISGKVDISRIIDGKETLIETLERGAVFGELAALTHDIRTAQAKAAEDTQVMIISKQLLFDEIRKLPPWMEKIVFHLAQKVSSMNERIHPFILSNCSLPVLKQLLYLFSIVNSNSENEKTVAIDYEGILHEISQNLGISTSRIEEVLQVLEEFKLAEKDGSDRFSVANITDLKNLIAYIKREQNITEGMNYSLDEISIQKIPLLDEVYQRMATLQY